MRRETVILVNRSEVFQVNYIITLVFSVGEPVLVDAFFEDTVQLRVLRLAIANYAKLGFSFYASELFIQLS